jgi:hypothetical protein
MLDKGIISQWLELLPSKANVSSLNHLLQKFLCHGHICLGLQLDDGIVNRAFILNVIQKQLSKPYFLKCSRVGETTAK